MKKGQASRARMIATAGELLQTQGYHGTGLKQILAESGAPRGSLYFHFPGGKEELVCAALHACGREWRDRLEAVIAGIDDLASAIQTVCAVLARELEESRYARGCPLATVALEQAARSPAVQKVCSDHYRGWEELIAGRILARSGDPEKARSLALVVLSAIEGALLLARTHHSTEPLDAVGAAMAEISRAL